MADTLIQSVERERQRGGGEQKGRQKRTRYREDGSKDVFYFLRLSRYYLRLLFLFVRTKIKDGNCFFPFSIPLPPAAAPLSRPLVEFLFLVGTRGVALPAPSLHGMTRRLCSRLLDFSPLFLLPILVPPFHTLLNGQKRLEPEEATSSRRARARHDNLSTLFKPVFALLAATEAPPSQKSTRTEPYRAVIIALNNANGRKSFRTIEFRLPLEV